MGHLTAPREVRDDIVGGGLAVPAVLRLEAVTEVRTVRDGEERRVSPPAGAGEPARLRDRGGPKPRVARDRGRGTGPEAGAAGVVLRLHGG